jgi:hypothetical protein
MKDPARTWNAVVVGEDTPCWSGTRRHELGLAGRQTIPSGRFQYLQLGVVMRRPEMLDIPRTTPRRVHDLHRRRTRRRLHRAHVGGHRPTLGTGT